MIRFFCPACNQRFSAADDGAGRKVECPCGQRVRVPDAKPRVVFRQPPDREPY